MRCAGNIDVGGGSSVNRPGNAGTVNGTVGPDAGGFSISGKITGNGGDGQPGGSANGGGGGLLRIKITSLTGGYAFDASGEFQFDGGASSGSGTAGAGGDMEFVCVDGNSALSGKLLMRGGEAPDAGGHGGGGGIIHIWTDSNYNGVGGNFMIQPSGLIDVSGGAGSIGGDARNNGGEGVALFPEHQEQLSVLIDTETIQGNSQDGVVDNQGLIISRGGVHGGTGGDVMFHGRRITGEDYTVSGPVQMEGDGGAPDGSFAGGVTRAPDGESRCSFASVGAKDNAETLTVLGREVRITNPDKPYFSRDVKLTKLDVVRYYLSVAQGAWPASAIAPSCSSGSSRRRRPGVLSEARARQPAAVAADGDAVVSVGPDRRRGGRRRRGRAGVDRQPRLHRAAPASGALGQSRSSRRAARRSRSGAGRRVGRRPARRAGGQRAARRAGAARLAKDQRLARHPRQRAHRAALDFLSAARRAGAVTRDRKARADAGDVEVVEGGAARCPRCPRSAGRCAGCPGAVPVEEFLDLALFLPAAGSLIGNLIRPLPLVMTLT